MKTPQEILEIFKEKNLPENFCIIPFVNLIFNPSGEVGVCRQKGTQHVVGNLEKNTVEDIWNNEYLQKWREEFLTGNVCICKREVEEDFCHLGSTNYEYFDEVILEKKLPLPMKKFTANFNGQCNLECIMCDVWKMPNGYYDKIDFWKKAEEEFFPFIKEMELLSGEPFVQKDTWKLIDNVSNINPECLWSFTTNAHWNLNNFIKEKLNKIKIKNIHLSIDSLVPERYSEIRKKGKLDIVLKNLEALKEYESQRVENGLSELGLSLHFLVMKNNWKELASVLEYTAEMGINLILDTLKDPSNLSIMNLRKEDRLEIINVYFKEMNKEQLIRSMRVISPLLSSLDNKDKKQFLIKLKDISNES